MLVHPLVRFCSRPDTIHEWHWCYCTDPHGPKTRRPFPLGIPARAAYNGSSKYVRLCHKRHPFRWDNGACKPNHQIVRIHSGLPVDPRKSKIVLVCSSDEIWNCVKINVLLCFSCCSGMDYGRCRTEPCWFYFNISSEIWKLIFLRYYFI